MDVNIQAPSACISCNEEAECKLNMIASVVSGFLSAGYNVSIDNGKYTLSASVKTKRNDFGKVKKDLSQVKALVESWYAEDVKNYRALPAEQQSSRAAEQQSSRTAEQQNSRTAEQQNSRTAG